MDIVVLLETRVKKDKATRISGKIYRGWEHINNYASAVNGRVWVNWNPRSVQVSIIEEQAILCEVLDIQTGGSQLLMAVYALNTVEHGKPLWEFISRTLHSLHRPILIGGDFNAILSSTDRYQGHLVQLMEVEDF